MSDKQERKNCLFLWQGHVLPAAELLRYTECVTALSWPIVYGLGFFLFVRESSVPTYPLMYNPGHICSFCLSLMCARTCFFLSENCMCWIESVSPSVFTVKWQIYACDCMESTKIRSKIIPSDCLSGFELRYKEFPLKLFQSDADLTLCIPRQSSKAVSWCRLNSVEFNSRWIPKRSLCITRGTRADGDAQPSTAQCASQSNGLLPEQWGKLARWTGANPGSGFAWWSGSADRLWVTVKTHTNTPMSTANNERISLSTV